MTTLSANNLYRNVKTGKLVKITSLMTHRDSVNWHAVTESGEKSGPVFQTKVEKFAKAYTGT